MKVLLAQFSLKKFTFLKLEALHS